LGISWALLYVGGLRAATEGHPNPGAASAIFTGVLNISMVIGPALGALLVPIGGYYLLIYVGAALSFGAFLYRQISLVRSRVSAQAPSGVSPK
jgi:predicted MFS family arabinose efflux permease